MKKKDLEQCIFCNKGMMHEGQPSFLKISVETHLINMAAVNETHGLEMFFGGGYTGAALANVMGTDPDITKKVNGAAFLVCRGCVMEKIPEIEHALESKIKENENEQ